METHPGYERLVERIISAARCRHAQMGSGHPWGEYVRAMEAALCDENLTFVELSPGTFMVEGAVAVTLDKTTDELRAVMATSGAVAGVWFDLQRETLTVERVLLAQDGHTPLIFPEASVLIAVMTHARDFELARDEGWYRIPMRSAPKFFPPDYVAFYFTRAFTDEAFSVRYFAPVHGHELVARRDLIPDEPDHPRADQPYYKLQIGRLVRREPPIVSKTWRRLTFVLTNGRRFAAATEINELMLGPKEHDILWRALKETGLHAERNYVIRDERTVHKVDMAVMCRDGAVGIQCSQASLSKRARQPGFPLLQFTPEQIEADMANCLTAIHAAVGQLGGAKQ